MPWVAARMAGEVVDWGPYARAVLRWAQVTGTLPPHPVEPGKTGMRLSPGFVEWLRVFRLDGSPESLGCPVTPS